MDRRRFLRTLGASAALAGSTVFARSSVPAAFRDGKPRALKNWAWMRHEIPSMDELRRKLARMKAAGIDAILIEGDADFYREVVPVAKDEGIELHAWFITMMRSESVAAHPEWYALSRKGVSTAEKPPYVDYYKFMCPSRRDVREHLRNYVRALAEIEGLAGVHLDYIRYPDVILPVALWPKYGLIQDKEYPEYDFCYCEVCRERFKSREGVDPLELEDPPGNRAWVQYRYDTVTEVVRLLSAEIRARKKQATAAVFPTPEIARRLVRQDWVRWDLDAVLPMVYHGFYKKEIGWIEQATRAGENALQGRIPLYTGLYVPDLPPRDLGQAVSRALAGGAQGISLFQGDTLTPDHWRQFSAALEGAGGRK